MISLVEYINEANESAHKTLDQLKIGDTIYMANDWGDKKRIIKLKFEKETNTEYIFRRYINDNKGMETYFFKSSFYDLKKGSKVYVIPNSANVVISTQRELLDEFVSKNFIDEINKTQDKIKQLSDKLSKVLQSKGFTDIKDSENIKNICDLKKGDKVYFSGIDDNLHMISLQFFGFWTTGNGYNSHINEKTNYWAICTRNKNNKEFSFCFSFKEGFNDVSDIEAFKTPVIFNTDERGENVSKSDFTGLKFGCISTNENLAKKIVNDKQLKNLANNLEELIKQYKEQLESLNKKLANKDWYTD